MLNYGPMFHGNNLLVMALDHVYAPWPTYHLLGLEMEYVYVRKSKFNKLVRNDSNGKIS
jgi:hypothetical protein